MKTMNDLFLHFLQDIYYAERLLLGSGVVRPGPGSWAEGIWCASKSGSS